MLDHSYVPQAPLSNFVHSLWLYRSDEPQSVRERILPSGTTELVISLRDDGLRISDAKERTGSKFFRRSLLSGPRCEYFDAEMRAPVYKVGVHFKPGGAYPFLGVPANELLNSFESLDAIWGIHGTNLQDRLGEAITSGYKFRILENFLLVQLKRSLPLNPAVAFVLKELQSASNQRPISQISEQIGISAKHFIQIFTSEVGLTPKLFCRIQRFQRVVKMAERSQTVKWGDLGLVCGYYDQAHLIHDFRAFSGCTPIDYLKRKTGHLNHLAM